MQPRRRFLKHLAVASVAMPVMACLAREAKPAAPKIRIGQIGVKHAHAGKLDVYRRSPDYDVVGIVEPDDRAFAAARQKSAFKGLKRLTRDELLNTPGLQAVLIETNVKDLLDNAEVCIDAGLHVHIDKPAGESLPHFSRILDKAKQQRLIVQMGYMYRYNPGVLLLRDLMNQGILGEIFDVRAEMSKVVNPADRRELAEYPGGIMFELGGHVMDLVIGILGKPDQVTGHNRRSRGSDDGLVDNMLAVLDYPSAVATVKSSAIEIHGGARRQLTVCGTEGTFHIQPLDQPSAKLALAKSHGMYPSGSQDIVLPKYVRYVDDAADMARCLRGEKEFGFSYEHDLIVQTALLTASGAPLD